MPSRFLPILFIAECKIFRENKVKIKMMPNAPNGFYTSIAPIRMMSLKASEESKVSFFYKFSDSTYRTRAIITRGLYILNPLFEGQKCFFKEVFSENSAFMYG